MRMDTAQSDVFVLNMLEDLFFFMYLPDFICTTLLICTR